MSPRYRDVTVVCLISVTRASQPAALPRRSLQCHVHTQSSLCVTQTFIRTSKRALNKLLGGPKSEFSVFHRNFWAAPGFVNVRLVKGSWQQKSISRYQKLPILCIPLPYTDLKPIITKYSHNKWQQTWNSRTQNKLYQIYPTIPF